MNELSLFTGAGGGVLGSKLLGHRIIGYVEYEKYCQEIIKQRISDGILDPAPVFGDIRRFILEGYAESYQGMVDLITGGFPCQPFSVAGKGLGEDDPRNMWPSTIECIRIIRPPFVFLENVPGLLTDKYMGRIFGDLAESGYDARWTCLGADDIGANHRRKRLWILAYTNSSPRSLQSRLKQEKGAEIASGVREEREPDVANPRRNIPRSAHRRGGRRSSGHGQGKQEGRKVRTYPANSGYALADSNGPRRPRTSKQPNGFEQSYKDFSNPVRSNGKRSRAWPEQAGFPESSNSNWWATEPDVGRVAHGVAKRVDRLKSLGNGQVPLAMAYAFSKLSEGIIEPIKERI